MKVGEDLEKLSAGKFLLDTGLLFEINRKVLHPFGLALQVMEYGEEDQDPNHKAGDVVLGEFLEDYRHDPEGMLFGEKSFQDGIAKLQRFMQEFGFARLQTRKDALRYTIQHPEVDFINPHVSGPKPIVKMSERFNIPDNAVKTTPEQFETEQAVKANTGPLMTAEEASEINVAERNMVLRAQAKMKKGITTSGVIEVPGEEYVIVEHAMPAGGPCPDPKVVSQKIRGGGTITFCASCGAQLKDSDLTNAK